MKKFIVLILVVLLLAGCGVRDMPVETASATEDVPTAVAETPTLQDGICRAGIHYTDMEYEHYQEERFNNLIAPIYRLAEQGGSSAEFDKADTALIDEINYVHTLLTLAKLKHSANPGDTTATAEYLYAYDLYQRLYTEYWQAMLTLSASQHKALIDERYGKDWLAEFVVYEDYEEDESNLFYQESILVSEYDSLMAQEKPDADAVADVFLQLVELRNTIAKRYGYDCYADYAYAKIYYRNYDPQDAEMIWHDAKEYFVPLMREYAGDAETAAALLQSDVAFDCNSDAILGAMGRILPNFSEELGTAFSFLLENGLYNIAFDTHKADEGYTVYLHHYEEPFIFNRPYGDFRDFSETIHEFGHWCNYYFCGSDLLFSRRDHDLAELQSQGLELLFARYYDEIYREHADAARNYVLMDKVRSVIDGAMYDEFLQRVYEESDPTKARVNEIFAELCEAYGYKQYEGCETEWMSIDHNFEDPFYYISYSVSALSALELYSLSLSDWDTAVDKYMKICGSDTEHYHLSEVLEDVGFGDIFAADACETLAASLNTEFAALLC